MSIELSIEKKYDLYFSEVIVRRKRLCILFGIIIGILVITAIVVPLTIVLTKRCIKITKESSSTRKGL